MLYDKIKEDLNSAMKERRDFELGVLRMLSAALHNCEIEKRSRGKSDVLSDEDVIAALAKEAKKRREAAELFAKGNRPELREKELKEVSVIEQYLPKQLSEAEIETEVRKIVERGVKEFNLVMKEVALATKGRADGKVVSEIVKKTLLQQ